MLTIISYSIHYYSVPYQLIGKRVDVRATRFTLECFHKGRRVASHVRSYIKGRFTTLQCHRPKTHQQYAGWTPQRMIQWASTVGPVAAETVEVIMHTKPYPEQGYRAAMGIIRLSDKYGKHRVEQACIYARQLNSENYRTIESVLRNGLEEQPIPKASSTQQIIEHDNIRGEDYFN